MLPVATAQVGCEGTATGADGVTGWDVMTTSADGAEVHPSASVTVKLYVPGVRDDMVALAPEPVIAPGLIVQLPAGRLLSITLPVVTVHVGWVIVPGAGAAGRALTVRV
jgi:hypothetical protein